MKQLVTGLALATAIIPGASAAEGRRFTLDPARSSVTVRTGKAGLFSFVGHSHLIRVGTLRGDVVADGKALDAATIFLAFEAASLTVVAEGEPDPDLPKIQARMTGSDLLDVVRFPDIVFHSIRVTGKLVSPDHYDLSVTGDLTLHGVTIRLAFPVQVEVAGEAFTAVGRASLRQTAFGLTPVSVGGVVKVKDEVSVDYKFVGIAAP